MARGASPSFDRPSGTTHVHLSATHTGRVLAQSAAELRRPQPRGRRYAHRDGGDAGDAAASLLARFPSQFAAPWAFAAGHDPGATVEATLLRLPLRTPESIAPAAGGPGVGGGGGGAAAGAAAGAGRLRELGVSEADARRALAAFASQAARGLLLARGPRAVSVSVWERGEAAARAVFSCRSALAQELQQPGSGGGPGGGGGGDPAVFPGARLVAHLGIEGGRPGCGCSCGAFVERQRI
jgi:hypothetical protein